MNQRPKRRELLEVGGSRRVLQVEHGLFAGAVILLIALMIWWVTMLGRWTDAEYQLRLDHLAQRARDVAPALVVPEVAEQIAIFDVVPGPPRHRTCARVPSTPDQFLCPKAEVLDAIESERTRRIWMIASESSFLALLLGVTVFMLFRLVRSERQFRREMEFFLGRVTHEMKTPLAGIKALLQTLKAGKVPAEALPEMVDLGLAQIDREERLLGNLLTIQKLRVAPGAVKPRSVRLAAWLAALVRARDPAATAPIEVDVPDDLTALADEDSLRSIVDNLLDNAFKYGATAVRLVGAPTPDGRSVTLCCIDDGKGFAPSEEGLLFAAFRRRGSSADGWAGGTGLGLHLSRQLARHMGGDLSAASDGEGLGATFTLTLPTAGEPA